MKTIYMDHAAATPLDTSVFAAMQPYFAEKFYNPSALYGPAQKVARDVRDARAVIAKCLGARPIEIVFTAGGTEANNIAVQGIMNAFPGSNMVVSSIEHDSVLEAAKHYQYSVVGVNDKGILDVSSLDDAVGDNTVLISIMYANNEIGTIQPIREIAQYIEKVKKARKASGDDLPLYLHTDAAQAANYLDLHVSRLGVDLMTLNGGKIYGPKQSGVLYIKSGVVLKPLVYGGGQERGLRSGTENVAGAIGFAMALELAVSMRNDEVRRLQELQEAFIHALQVAIPDVLVNGSLKKRLPNNVHVTIPGEDNERLLFELDNRGILAAAGSACSASSEEASHVLHALGLSDETARSSLRFTMGRSTTKEDIETVVSALVSTIAR